MDPIHMIPSDRDDADDDDDPFVTPAEAEILERALVRGTPAGPTDEDFAALWRWVRGVQLRVTILDLVLKEQLVASIDPDGKVRWYAACFFPRDTATTNPPG